MSEVSFQENVICHLGTEKLASEKKKYCRIYPFNIHLYGNCKVECNTFLQNIASKSIDDRQIRISLTKHL